MSAGFDCEFVERPPSAFQVDCPVCMQVLREPYQVTCCGKSYCRECIERVKEAYGKCSTCNSQNFDLFHNLGLEQSLYDFEVYCSHKSKGCEWRGELRELDKHLNSEPPTDKSLEGCPFTVIKCPLGGAGCEVKLPRNQMNTHIAEGVVTHTLLQAVKVQQLLADNESLKSRLYSVENKSYRLEHNVAKLLVDKTDLQERVQVLEEKVKELDNTTHKFMMQKFYKYRHEHKEWRSPPFYTHQQGYRLCLVCDASSKVSHHLGVYVCLMMGEFDEFLEFPVRGELTIHLVDQSGSGYDRKHRFRYDSTASVDASCRVKRKLLADAMIGAPEFILLSDLHPRYLKNDRLVFKVTDINFLTAFH